MGTLNLALLGGFEASVDGHALEGLPTRKARALLAVLATAPGHRRPRDQLATMLWERSAEEQARASLRQTLASVRKALAEAGAENVLEADSDNVWLDAERLDVDALAFARLVEADDPQSLDAAWRLYSGDFLVGLNLREESFEQWLIDERRRFQELARRAFGRLLDQFVGTDNHARATEIATRLLAIDPLQEHVHRALMTIHARDGRRGLALRQFETCRAHLERELGVAPEAATTELAESIRNKETQTRPATEAASETDETRHGPESHASMAFPGEIRPVTVLFARFSAADEDHAPLDPEQHLRLAQAFQASAQAAVDHYGGHIDSCIGDTVVAVFGTPVAHGNDAERALRAAVDIRDSVPALSEEQVRPVAAHVGVAAGQVVVSAEDADQGGYAMTGDSVDSARQLELKSRSGEVLATQVLLAGADRFFDSQPAPELNLRSRGRSLPVQRILAVRATPRRNRPTRFVGRRLELGQIQSVLDACRDPGHAHIVYVRGEPGIGKTRLLEETAIHAEAQGFACYRVLILDFGTSKNEEVQRALARGLLGLSPGAEPQQVEFVADLAVSENRTAVERRVFLNDLLDVPQPLALKSRFDAMDESVRNQGRTDVLTDLVHHRSTQVPVLIMIEDLHWADAPVIERLAVVASALRDQPVVLLMTSRVEGDPLDPSWRTTTREIPLVTIDLRPLTEVDAALMAGELSEEDEEIRRRCIERAQGNPLFLEQLLRATSEYDESDAIPSSVQELALSRSDRLETPDRDALRAASVLGQRFALDALHHLLQRPDYACTELVAHDLVRPDRGGFLFAHALIREGIYASLLSETRRALHLRAAEWFAGSDLALRANHLEAAGDSSAADAYLAAARQEFRAYRAERGLQLAQRGLQVGGEADCCRLHNLEGEIYYHVGPVSGSLKAFRAALESAPDEVDRCHALVGMAMGLRMVDDYDGAVAALDEAEPIAEAHELWDDLARICITRANLAFWKGHTDKCLPDGERALDYARRAKSVELEVHALGIIGDAHYAVGRMRSAHDHFERCVDAARRHGLGRVEVAHRCQTAGGTLQYMLDLRRSLDLSVEAVSLSAEIGSLRSEMQSNLSASNAAFFVGELALSRKHADGALELANQLGAVRTKARYRYYCARILVAEGKRREARKMLEEAYSISEETGAGYTGAAILGGLARVTEDPQQRSEVLSLGEALLAKGAVGHNFLEFYEDAMEASLENEEWKQALRYAALLEDYVGSEPLPLTDLLLARTRALVAFGQGKRDESLFRELRRLVEEAREHELMLVVPALEAALAQRHV